MGKFEVKGPSSENSLLITAKLGHVLWELDHNLSRIPLVKAQLSIGTIDVTRKGTEEIPLVHSKSIGN